MYRVLGVRVFWTQAEWAHMCDVSTGLAAELGGGDR